MYNESIQTARKYSLDIKWMTIIYNHPSYYFSRLILHCSAVDKRENTKYSEMTLFFIIDE